MVDRPPKRAENWTEKWTNNPELSKRSAWSFVSTTLKMMIDAELLAPLYPKTPHHPKQKYYLTEQGKTMLAYLRNTDCME